MRNKKGISPLIATVLLIGFTVALGVLTYLWLSGTLSLQAKKGEVQCGPNDIAELEFSVPSCTLNNNHELTLQVSNQGKKRIDGFWIAMENGPTPLLPNNVKPGNEEKIGLSGAPDIQQDDDNNALDVELIPVIIENSVVKTCASNSVKVQCSSS
ncbi:MAG: archaellin/type IV pilin N-terminal domain-containing protein [Nanoarchaeota archaeon]